MDESTAVQIGEAYRDRKTRVVVLDGRVGVRRLTRRVLVLR